MSWQSSANAKKITHFKCGARLSPTDKCVLMLLADYTHPDSGLAYPSVATLALYAGLTTRGARLALGRLRDGGVIKIQARCAGGRSMTNHYSLVDICYTPEPACNPEPPFIPEPQCSTPLNGGSVSPLNPGSAKPHIEPHIEPQGPPPPQAASVLEVSEAVPSNSKSTVQADDPAEEPEASATAAVLEEVWAYYHARLGRSPTYLLTRERRAMGQRGLAACRKLARSLGSIAPLQDAGAYMKLAIERLAADEFHNATGKHAGGVKYRDWHQLFRGKNYPCPQKLTDFWLDDDKWG